MIKILKTEICRSFSNKRYLISLLIASAIVIWYSLDYLSFHIGENAAFTTENFPMNYLKTSYEHWLGIEYMAIQQYVFLLLLPILAVLPFGSSLYSDMKQGYAKNICIRTKKSHYIISKYIAVFISGGSVCAFPLILSFLISSAFLPSVMPQATYWLTNVFGEKWSALLFTYPLAYVSLYIILTFVVSGFIACFALGISYISDKSFLPLVFPFFIYIFISLLCELLKADDYSIMNILKASGGTFSTLAVIIVLVLLFVFSFFPYYIIGKKKDVF